MAVEKQLHLQEVLETLRMSHIDELISKYKTKRDEIKEALEENYSDNIYAPFNSGSFAKHTAINTKFDLDLVVPFKRNSFETIESMFQGVFDFLEEKYGQSGIAEVRKQKVSIGVRFYADDDGEEINIDVVPGRELSIDNFPDTKNLNVYFNDNHWGFSKGTYTQTNIQSQIDHIKGKENARKVIRLFKRWKNSNNEPYKSFLLELATIKAFEKEDITGNLWEKLKSVMEYLKENISKDNFKLIDPGNSNNDVMSSMESWEKSNLANKLELIIVRVEENSENIKTYFPINDDYISNDEDKTSNSKYGLKNGVIPSIPPTNQRFG
jgi:tRNA nucleotidyltransferase (CCA-adding enzyme)